MAHYRLRQSYGHGAAKLTLAPENYAWEFIAVGGTVRDSGNAPCR